MLLPNALGGSRGPDYVGSDMPFELSSHRNEALDLQGEELTWLRSDSLLFDEQQPRLGDRGLPMDWAYVDDRQELFPPPARGVPRA